VTWPWRGTCACIFAVCACKRCCDQAADLACVFPQVRLSVVRIFRRMSEHVRRLSSVGAAPLPEGDLEEGDPAAGPHAKSSQNGRGSDAGSNDSDKRKVRVGAVRKHMCQHRRRLVSAGLVGRTPVAGRAQMRATCLSKCSAACRSCWHYIQGLPRCPICAA